MRQVQSCNHDHLKAKTYKKNLQNKKMYRKSLLFPVESFNEASTLSLSALAIPQILYSTVRVLAFGQDQKYGTDVLGRLRHYGIYRVKYIINLAKKPLSIAPLNHESFLGRNLGHTRRSGYRWMKVSF